jgi:RNA polymerase sigma-70 factor, ECF subfamily
LSSQVTLLGMAVSAGELMQQTGAQTRAVVCNLPVAPDDAAIVSGVRRGERWAKAALIHGFAPDAQRVLGRILGRDPDIEDLVQDVFVRALEGIDRLQEPQKLRSWIVAIAVHRARERIRSRRRRWWLLLLPHTSVEAFEDHRSADRELSDATYAVLDKMQEDERVALALRWIEGMGLAEVASACGVSLATIKRRLDRAEEHFRVLAAEQPALEAWSHGGDP